MNVVGPFVFSCFVVLLLIGCSGSKGEAGVDVLGKKRILALDEGSGQAALEKRYADFGTVLETDEDGTMRIAKGVKRSSFEGKEVTQIGGERAKKEYNFSRYQKKDWAGGKRYSAQKYQGNRENRWQNAEWFLRKEARASGQAAREAGTNFRSKAYEAASAREAGKRTSRDYTGSRSNYEGEATAPPLILSKDQYEQLSVNEVNRRLGR